MTTAISPFQSVNPMANGAGSDKDSGTAASVSANDFLLLLVTEMKNQDPTAQTDPTQYINQLVQVNSLEQLIEINENLSAVVGGATPEAAGARSSAMHSSAITTSASDVHDNGWTRGANGVAHPVLDSANPIAAFAGNLGISRPIPAAQRIAQALNGRG